MGQSESYFLKSYTPLVTTLEVFFRVAVAVNKNDEVYFSALAISSESYVFCIYKRKSQGHRSHICFGFLPKLLLGFSISQLFHTSTLRVSVVNSANPLLNHFSNKYLSTENMLGGIVGFDSTEGSKVVK